MLLLMVLLPGSDQVIYPHSQASGLPSSHLYAGVPRVNAGELLSSQHTRSGPGSSGKTSIYLFIYSFIYLFIYLITYLLSYCEISR